MTPLGPSAMLYLAAAVSDFFVPWAEMAEHKIQSSGGGLHLSLDRVPKALGTLRTSWAPRAMIISFKLETDHELLLEKAAKSISEYNVDMVVANELHSRKDVVFLVTPLGDNNDNKEQGSEQHSAWVQRVERPIDDPIIERVLVNEVVAAHRKHMERHT